MVYTKDITERFLYIEEARRHIATCLKYAGVHPKLDPDSVILDEFGGLPPASSPPSSPASKEGSK